MGNQHDHNRIGARKMRRAARGAVALPACVIHHGFKAAAGAVAVVFVPRQNGLAGRGEFGVTRAEPCHHSAHFDESIVGRQHRVALFALIDERPQLARVEVIGHPRRQVIGKTRGPLFAPQQNRSRAGIRQNGVIQRQTHNRRGARGVDQDLTPPEQNGAGGIIGAQCGHGLLVGANLSGAVKR